MGEQMLSREYYYLGTQLPMDRFLTFYYGHPGFHINNILVILAVQIFLVTRAFSPSPFLFPLERMLIISASYSISRLHGFSQSGACDLQV
jgi:hypothetical protein